VQLCPWWPALLQHAEKRLEVRLLVGREVRLEDQVEELYRVGEREQASVVQVRRGVFDPAQRKRLDGPVGRRHRTANQTRGVETSGLQIVHGIVSVVRRRMTARAPRLADKQVLPALLRGRSLPRIELAEDV